jgi:hypothetical protein
MQKRAAGIVSDFITDTFGKELKPWVLSETERDEKYEQG